MRNLYLLFAGFCLVCAATVMADDDPMAEFKNCGICGSMCQIEGMFERVKCDAKIIDNGMVSVTVVPDDMKEAMESANADMEAAIQKIMNGEQMELCSFCQSMGKLHQSGAKIEKIDMDFAQVMLVTSEDPEVVKQIHDHAKMMMKMKEQMMQGQHSEKLSQR